jgi:hypothetical protein
MADKFLKQSGGFIQEVVATVTSTGAAEAGDIPALDTNGRLTDSVMSRPPTATSAGAADAAKLVALDGTGKIAVAMMPVEFGEDVRAMMASEDLLAGDFVNVWNDAGVAKIRKADATAAGKAADGFIIVPCLTGASVSVYFEGTNAQCSGLTPGQMHFLSATQPGKPTTVVPTGSGQVVQCLGKALSASEINIETSQPIIELA